MNKKIKVSPTKINKSNFIKFSSVQQAYLDEIRAKQFREVNMAVRMIYEELGIVEKFLKAEPGTYKLRLDNSGVDVLPVEKK